MSNLFVSFMFAIGVSSWFYFKIMRRTGGVNGKGALVLVGLIGFIAFLAFFMVLEKIGR